ncbi:MAG: PorT family protein [Prevotella sp.]|nr:PorT family protein [Prevotella sp.]
MKKLFITMAVALVALTASAQRASSTSSSFFSTEKANLPVTFGIRGGLNISSMSLKDDSDLKSRAGFNIGVAVDFPIMESFYVQSGLYYTSKGFKLENEKSRTSMTSGIKSETKVNIGYLEIPVLASYRYNFNDANQLQFNFGPYFAYGLHGKEKEKTTLDDGYVTHDKEYDWYSDLKAKHFDLGLQIGLGITLAKHYYAGIAYEFGLVSQVKDADGYVKNRNFMVNVGYQF